MVQITAMTTAYLNEMVPLRALLTKIERLA
jgi:hypothetical protein